MWMWISLTLYVLGAGMAFIAITDLEEGPDSKEWAGIVLWPVVCALAVFLTILQWVWLMKKGKATR